jgi:hypothetical protein
VDSLAAAVGTGLAAVAVTAAAVAADGPAAVAEAEGRGANHAGRSSIIRSPIGEIRIEAFQGMGVFGHGRCAGARVESGLSIV